MTFLRRYILVNNRRQDIDETGWLTLADNHNSAVVGENKNPDSADMGSVGFAVERCPCETVVLLESANRGGFYRKAIESGRWVFPFPIFIEMVGEKLFEAVEQYFDFAADERRRRLEAEARGLPYRSRSNPHGLPEPVSATEKLNAQKSLTAAVAAG